MPTARELRTASRKVLRQHILHGHPVDPRELEGWVYRGTSLGLPRFAERLTWKTFQKAFYRDPATGALRGWNIRLEQDGIDAPSRPKLRDGVPATEWYYEVVEPVGVAMPRGFDRGLCIAYGREGNPPGMELTRDPLVALMPGSADELIGVSCVALGGVAVETPTYFTLEREARIDFVPDPTARRAFDPTRLSRVERRWAEALFAGILGVDGASRLPGLDPAAAAAFWRRFEVAPPPLVRAGLRPMIYALTFAPLAWGFGRPFFALGLADRARALERAEGSGVYFVRQSLSTLKMLGAFAYFEDPDVRARFAVEPPGAAS